MSDKNFNPKYRSQQWFDNPSNPGMTALYLERSMNFGLTPDELRSGKPIIGIAQTGSDISPCNRVHIKLAERVLKTIPNSKSKLIQIDYPNEYPKDEPMRRCPNIDKYYEEFNQKPSIGIDEGLYKFYQYAKKNWL